jgi:hypothetical protein
MTALLVSVAWVLPPAASSWIFSSKATLASIILMSEPKYFPEMERAFL